jgi:nanoRNase/pAp phosphatase (c-di-AMP/oligoRNAs hydrolase)
MKLSGKERLRRFYEQFSGTDQVLIVVNADPDAIASAMAVKRLLWRKVAGVTLSHFNPIKRPDNIAMIRLLGVRLQHLEEIRKDRFTRFVTVDSQPSHNEAFDRFDFDVVIDHHPRTEVDAPFVDIRPEYGATASILTEYLRAARIKPSGKLATGLFIGIKTDTHDFERPALNEDVKAFQFLFRHANIHLARKIEQSDLRLDFLKYFRYALHHLCMRKGRALVHLGPVMSPDVCVVIADFFMRVNPVKWSIVSGIHEDRLIIIFRNDGIRKNAGRMAKTAFEALGSAGGHRSVARAEIPVENLRPLVDVADDKKTAQWVIDQIEKNQKGGKTDFQKAAIGRPT